MSTREINSADNHARIVVVERDVKDLKESFAGLSSELRTSVSDLGRSFTAAIADQSKQISTFITEQHRQPRAIPFKEIIATAGATMAVFYGILTFLDSRSEPRLEHIKYRLEQAEKDLEKLAPLKHMRMFVTPPAH